MMHRKLKLQFVNGFCSERMPCVFVEVFLAELIQLPQWRNSVGIFRMNKPYFSGATGLLSIYLERQDSILWSDRSPKKLVRATGL